jgi:hypothetical protein
VPDRPDFGETSLDCPPDPLAIFSTVPDPSPIAITSATDPVTKTVTASSPTCGDLSGENCLCDTCNNINREPCTANADCPDPAGPIGPICGGTRCLGGANDGAACTSNTVCPGGLCNRAGWPSSPSSCLDNTATANILDCTDVDGEGECTEGPVGKSCSVASGHAQRGCLTDVDCGCAPSSGCCEAHNRPCFPTGTRTGTGKVGTQTLIANGMEDTPMGDTSSPTLGAVYCARPFVAQAVNTVIGLPGPARVTIKGTAVSRP